MIPTIEFTEAEIESGNMTSENFQKAITEYKDAGCLLLKNVFKPGYIKTLNDSFVKKYSQYLKEKDHKDALQVGDKRYMISLKVEVPFNNQKIYANPLVMPIIEGILGDNCILNGYGSVVSLPGAELQNTHYDHPFLFDDDEIDPLVPSYAITAIVPLVDITEETGATVMMTKSHRLPSDLKPEHGSEPVYPYTETGSVILMDFKLRHAGQANRSEQVRPIMYNIYSRPWFRDSANYGKQADVQINKKELAKVPEQYQRLFQFAKVT